MTAHNYIQDDDGIAATFTPSNKPFDELDGIMADCHAIPVGVPVSHCASEGTCASSATDYSTAATVGTASTTVADSVTGRFSDIEERYLVDPHVLGSGHHGSVRECIDRATGERCAVKSVRKDDPSVKPGGLAREISLLQEMQHENIVRLVDVFEDERHVHIVTDLCTGGELFDKILEKSSSKNGATCFAEDEAARILHQILTSVSHMHSKNVVHRDIKPENILFESKDKDSRIKIIDFGLARKHYGSLGEPPMSTIVGTPYYISPDVLRKCYDKSCDLWSVGIVAYVLLVGYPPFNGRNNDEIHRAVLSGRYRFHAADWKHVSPEARDFVGRLLKRDPNKRMTAEEALRHPWLARHTGKGDVVLSRHAAIEVVARGSSAATSRPKKDSILSSSGRIARRKMRQAMFGI